MMAKKTSSSKSKTNHQKKGKGPNKSVKEQSVAVAPAKGRPMLNWVGKHALRQVNAFPAQHVETFAPLGPEKAKWADWPKEYPQGGLLFHGDNKEVLAHLLANGFRGKVKLIYIDPPFDSGADYVRKVSLRGPSTAAKLDGDNYTLGEQIQYSDIWANDNYLQFIYERLLLLKELLAEHGSFYFHCDWHKDHLLRCVVDEVFGANNFQNEIIWQRTSARSDSHTYNHIHDVLLFYTKSDKFQWNQIRVEHDREYIDQFFKQTDTDGRRFQPIDLTAAGTRRGETGKSWRGIDPNIKGRHWCYPPDVLDKLDEKGKIFWPGKEGGMPRLKQYLDELDGKPLQTIWTDINVLSSHSTEREDYPTQKPAELLERIVSASSGTGDLVLDCFIGSGTTAAVAQKLGRRWIGCDINKGAAQTTSKRLQGIIFDQIEKQKKEAKQQKLDFKEGDKNDKEPVPAQLSFQVYRVNDYDLQIQHNEAVSLACEHIGVQRTHNDAFFDGVQGKRLVKIVPFNHPLSPLDLEQIKNELKVRPEENRDILVVALGKELASDAWLEEWNRLRRKGDVPNKIEVIELRTDPKYGKFIEHKPAGARVKFGRKNNKVTIEIEDFISPTIIERLSQQNGVVQPRVKDWRSMVDCVMIDPAYDGKIFNVALSDVPERKDDFVHGKYELPVDSKKTRVAVKIIDILGEEVVEVREV